jgi:hypothetical protein
MAIPRGRQSRRSLPPITRELLAAFKAGNVMQFHILMSWYPWEISPLRVHEIPEPEEGTSHPYFSTWWRAKAIRERLEEAMVREDMKR